MPTQLITLKKTFGCIKITTSDTYKGSKNTTI